MVQAVLAIEDRRFFEHGGINYMRIAKCAVEDTLTGHKECGGSTLTMQLARGFFLSPEKKFTRKLVEIMITFQLEARFNKQQIFEMYANQMNIGRRGSFEINGFGEAAESFFGKDLRQLDLAECALIAGLIQNPSYAIPIAIPTAPWSGATWCWTRWWRPGPSRSRRPTAPRPSRCASPRPTSTRRRRPTSSTSCMTSSPSAWATRSWATTRCASTPRSTRNCSAPPPRRWTPG